MRKRLDAVFSKYIRHRDCPDGVGYCITCGAKITPTTCDAGHYISRRVTATRWNEMNVNAQCVTCNRLNYGATSVYRRALVKRYGEDAVLRLEERRNKIVHLTATDIKKLTEYFQSKLKEYG